MNFPYDLWPIWCDYLEEQGQDTELLRYMLIWVSSCVGTNLPAWNDGNGINGHIIYGYWKVFHTVGVIYKEDTGMVACYGSNGFETGCGNCEDTGANRSCFGAGSSYY